MEQFARINTLSRELNDVQGNVERVLREFTGRAVNDSVFIEGLILQSSFTFSVKHGLGRFLRGWIVARQSAPGFIYEHIPDPDDTDLFIHLRTTAPTVTVSMLVF